MTKRTLTVGKYRAIQRASTRNGTFSILANDHIDSLRRALNSELPMSISDQDLVNFKLDVVGALAGLSSGVLLDPVYGASQAIVNDLVHDTGLLVALEKSDYEMAPLPRVVEIRHGWNVEKIKRMGGDGVKLFFYYNPDDLALCSKQDRIIMQEVALCEMHDIPLYVEPVLVDSRPEERPRLMIDAAARIANLGVDILKLEFPVDIHFSSDRRQWQDVCEALTQAIDIPWVLLSASTNFETFEIQLEIACRSGAAGFIAGRAVWGEASRLANRDVRQEWLRTKGRSRIASLTETARQFGSRWTDYFQPPEVTTRWYRDY